MDKETIAAYTKFADAYDLETSRFWELFPVSVVEEFTKRVRGKIILDLGSGPGRDASILKDKGFDVICVDASSIMVAKTRELGFQAVLMDIENLGFQERSVDGVWAYTSLIHVQKARLPTTLKDIHKSLIDGGILGLGMMEGNQEVLKESDSMPGARRLFVYYQEQELCHLLQAAGFDVEFAERFKPNQNTYLNFVCRKV